MRLWRSGFYRLVIMSAHRSYCGEELPGDSFSGEILANASSRQLRRAGVRSPNPCASSLELFSVDGGSNMRRRISVGWEKEERTLGPRDALNEVRGLVFSARCKVWFAFP
jgi:hypothetical protein